MIQFCKVPSDIPAFTGWLLFLIHFILLRCFFGHEIFISDLNDFFLILPFAARRRNDDATMIWYDIAYTYASVGECFRVCKLERKKLKWDKSTWEMLLWVRVSLFISGYLWLNSILFSLWFRLGSYAFIMCVSLFLFPLVLLLVSNCVGLGSVRFAFKTPSHRNFHVKYFTRSSFLHDCI